MKTIYQRTQIKMKYIVKKSKETIKGTSQCQKSKQSGKNKNEIRKLFNASKKNKDNILKGKYTYV